MKQLQLMLIAVIIGTALSAKEYHVAKTGNDKNPGTSESPLLTIQAAANNAHAGDIIIVHAGIYRERVTPPRGGESNSKRIVYRATEGEKVEIKGSEIINTWQPFKGNVWKAVVPNSLFGDYNPYKDLIYGDWFIDNGRIHHTGDVYLNGKALWEMEIIEKVLHPKTASESYDPEGSTYTWYCESNEENTYIYANFHEFNPNEEQVEINVRKTCFYPEETSINYITIRGFQMSNAATQWAPPTAEQIGLIGTNWSKGWIIENNIIRNSKCSGITLGKYGDKFDNTSQNSAEGYVTTIERATKRGWSRENIGSHIIRNNIISDCEQTGICGSMGGIFSIIENNNIYNIWAKRMFTGHEMGGIKIHAPIDMLIKNNRLTNCGRGLWLDWMCQGCRVTGNLFYGNTTDDIYVEVNHGPFIIDNNILLSKLSVRDCSEGGAFVHNLIAGNIIMYPPARFTPLMEPHSTKITELKKNVCGDNRFYNNVFLNGFHGKDCTISGLKAYVKTELPVFVDGNVYLNGVSPFKKEQNNLQGVCDPKIIFDNEGNVMEIDFMLDKSISKIKTEIITTEILGKALVPNQEFTNPDGSDITIDNDFWGNKRNKKRPTPGPFEKPGEAKIRLSRN